MPTGIYKRKPFTKKHKKNLSLSWTNERRLQCIKFMKNRPIKKSTLKKLKLFQCGKNNPMYGKHFKMSKEHKRKIGEAQLGSKNHMWRGGKIKRICKICKGIFYVKPSRIKWTGAHCCSPKCNGFWVMKHKKSRKTDIEIAIENELKRQYIPYLYQAPIENIALVDFLLPNKIIIQCDGIYWHNKPNVKQRDKKQDIILTSYGYKIFRFTDIEINKSTQKCLEKIYGKLF